MLVKCGKVGESMEKPIQQTLKLTVYEFISVNHYLAYRVVYKNGRPTAMSYKTAEAQRFKREFTEYVKKEVKKQGWIMSTNPYQHYYVDAVFYFPRVDMDCANYDKLIADSITDSGCVWLDDNCVCNRIIKVMYDNKNPRIELTIHPTDFVGIFDGWKEAIQFENKCKTCKRYNKNCSILRKAFEGRIQSEIVDGECTEYKEM